VTGASVSKFSLFDNQQFTAFVDRLHCPVIIARDFTILGVSKVKNVIMRIARK
jgi:basic amino acid/polyamine antiporter, APA family